MLELSFEEEFLTTEPEPIKPDRYLGIVDDLDFDTYQKAPGMNNSGLKTFHLSPKKYITEKHHRRPETRAFRVGHAFHCLVFEPKKFDRLYIASKYKNYQSNEAKAWKLEMEARGFTVLTTTTTAADPFWSPPEWDMVHRMAESVLGDPVAEILVKGVFERSIFWVDRKKGSNPGTGKLCKARLDGYNPEEKVIVDLKSAKDASFSGFTRAVHEYRYDRQESWYMDGATSEDVNMDVSNGFVFIVCEHEPPWEVKVYRLPPEWVRQAREENRRDMEHYALCHNLDVWLSYGERLHVHEDGTVEIMYTGIRDLSMPNYAMHKPIS